MTTFAPPVGDPPAVQFVAVQGLKVDLDYQRPTDNTRSQALINAIARGWDWRLYLPLLISLRDDGPYVVDGQHRAEGAARRGDIAHLPVVARRYASPAEEAQVFVAVNRRRKAMTNLDDFRAAVTGGDAAAVTIARLVDAAGLRMASNARGVQINPGEIAFTTSLYAALARHGDELVGRALSAMGRAFPSQTLTAGAAIFNAVLALVADKAGPVDARLVNALQGRSAADWAEHPALVEVRGGGHRARALREAIRRAADGPMLPACALAPAAQRPSGPAAQRPSGPAKIDLSRAPSSMEQRAAGWAGHD